MDVSEHIQLDNLSEKAASERGFTVLEAVVSAALLFLALVGFLTVIMARASSVEMARRIRRAHDAADSALERLSAYQPAPSSVAGTFTEAADNRITLSPCTIGYCDLLYVDSTGAQVGNKSSVAGGTTYGSAVPAGAQLEFVRRWRVTTVPTRPDVYELTLAVLTSETSTEPLVIVKTRVGTRTLQ